MKPFLIALFLCMLSVGCTEQKPATAEASSLKGALEDGTFRNEFFGFRFAIPEGWTVADEEKQGSLIRELKTLDLGNGDEVHLMLYREEEGAALPDIFLIASNPNPNPTVSGLDDAFSFLRRSAEEAPNNIVVRRAHSGDVGGVLFAKEELRDRVSGQYLSHHALALRGQVLSFQVHSQSRRRMEDVARQMTGAVEFETGRRR